VALSKFVLTSTVTVPAGTLSTPVAGEPGSGGAAGYGSASVSAGAVLFSQVIVRGTPVVLDPSSALYTFLNGQGVLRAWVQGADNVSHAATGN
jgi:hypothetical protein